MREVPGRREASFLAFTDGTSVLSMASLQDHKAVYDGMRDEYRWMGAYSPAPVVTEALHEKILKEILRPLIDGMAAEGGPIRAFCMRA